MSCVVYDLSIVCPKKYPEWGTEVPRQAWYYEAKGPRNTVIGMEASPQTVLMRAICALSPPVAVAWSFP